MPDRHHFSKYSPALPLYMRRDAELALERFIAVETSARIELGASVSHRFLLAGHSHGASMILVADGDGSILFSRDLERPDAPVMQPVTQEIGKLVRRLRPDAGEKASAIVSRPLEAGSIIQ